MLLLDLIAEPATESCDERLETLITRLAEGDIEAMAPLYELIKTPVNAYALSLLRDPHEAEDVLHDCCLKLFRGADSYERRGKPMAFILTIAKNLCLDRIREKDRRADIDSDQWENLLRCEDVPSSLPVAQWLEVLAPRDRQIVLLHVLAGFKHRETAEFMGIPTATVITRYARSLKKLREHITRERT